MLTAAAVLQDWYRSVASVGRGAGVVWHADDLRLGCPVAVNHLLLANTRAAYLVRNHRRHD